jgi:predicted dehydrogenase
MSNKPRLSRRGFLAASAGAALVPHFVPASVLGRSGAVAPNEKINIGLIGCGGMGRGNAGAFMRSGDARIVAVCDVDEKHLAEAARDVNKHYGNEDCKTFKDYRELIAMEGLDAVCIATPDHWHALCGIAAAKAKKDIFCQKPMTHTFAEGRALANAVAENKVIFQVGSQQRSGSNFREGVEIVINGHLGKILRVEVGLPTGSRAARGSPEELREQDPPKHVDYDFWCGPSPKLGFVPKRFHWDWRWHLAFGGGQLMDWIGHHNDIAHWGLGVDDSGPIEVRAAGFRYPEDRRVWNAAFDYEVICKYESGVESSISNKHEMGCRWIGEDGWVHVTRGPSKASNPAWIASDFDRGPKKAYDSPEHHRNFLDSIKSRKPCICTAEIGHRSITPGHLGLLSESLGGRLLHWDPKTETITGDAEADKLLKRVDFRAPWVL